MFFGVLQSSESYNPVSFTSLPGKFIGSMGKGRAVYISHFKFSKVFGMVTLMSLDLK